MEATLRQKRLEKKLTQQECAKFLGIPLRTYIRYETEEGKSGSFKYSVMLEKLDAYGFIDEEHGILALEQIKEVCAQVFRQYDVEFCYLFGSYSRGEANEKSDVDFLISTSTTGLKFFGLVEELRESLKKKVDLLDLVQLTNNEKLIHEVLKDGIRIYG